MTSGLCQLVLPDGGERMSRDELERMVYQQASLVNVQKWESALLVESCNKLGCLGQGMSRLYQYAGYQDKVFARLKKRYDIAKELDTAIKGSSDKLPRKISKMAFATANLISSICQWRQEQWSPRPLTELLPNETEPILVCEIIRRDARKLLEKVRLQALAVEQAQEEGFSAVDGGWVSRCDVLSLSLLLAPVKGPLDIEQLVSGTSNSSRTFGPDSANLFNELLDYRTEDIPDQQLWLTVIGAVQTFLSLENEVNAFWHSRINIMRESSYKVEQTCPLLRLPYVYAGATNAGGPPCINFSWFGEKLNVYSAIRNIMERVLQLTNPNPDPYLNAGASINEKMSNAFNAFDDGLSDKRYDGNSINNNNRFGTGATGRESPPGSLPIVTNRTLKSTMMGMTANGIIAQQEEAERRCNSKIAQLSTDNRKFVPEKELYINSGPAAHDVEFGHSRVTQRGLPASTAQVFEPFRQAVPAASLASFVPQIVLATTEVQYQKMEAYSQQVQLANEVHVQSGKNRSPIKTSSPKTGSKMKLHAVSGVPLVVPKLLSPVQLQQQQSDGLFVPADVNSGGTDPMGDFIISASRTFKAQREKELLLQEKDLRLHQQEQERALALTNAANRAATQELDDEVARMYIDREVTKSMGVLPLANSTQRVSVRRSSSDPTRPRTAGAVSIVSLGSKSASGSGAVNNRRKSTEMLANRAAAVVNTHQQRLNQQVTDSVKRRKQTAVESPGSDRSCTPITLSVQWEKGESPLEKNLFSTGDVSESGELIDGGGRNVDLFESDAAVSDFIKTDDTESQTESPGASLDYGRNMNLPIIASENGSRKTNSSSAGNIGKSNNGSKLFKRNGSSPASVSANSGAASGKRMLDTVLAAKSKSTVGNSPIQARKANSETASANENAATVGQRRSGDSTRAPCSPDTPSPSSRRTSATGFGSGSGSGSGPGLSSRESSSALVVVPQSSKVQLVTPKRITSPMTHGRKTAGGSPTVTTSVAESSMQRSPFKSVSPKRGTGQAAYQLSKEDVAYLENPRGPSGEAMPQGFTSRTMKTLGMFASVSKPFSRGEARSEAQVLHIALKDMKTKSLTRDMRMLAAKKLTLWWRFLYPRFRFVRYQARKRFLREDIVSQLLLDRTFAKVDAHVNAKQQVRCVGAALIITRYMIRYCNSFIPFVRRLQKMWRAYRKKHAKRFNHARRERLRKESEAAKIAAIKGGYQYIPRRMPNASIHRVVNSAEHSKNFRQVNKRVAAAIVIQTMVRRIQACYHVLMRRSAYAMISHFIKYYKAKKLWKSLKPRIRAAKLLQQRIRGYHARKALKERVIAGIVITNAYRRFLRRAATRKQLHRCDRPVTIVLHGIRNIPKDLVYTDEVSVKMSVWWSQLLHIVAERDFGSIVASKTPNYTHQTKFCPIQEQADTQVAANGLPKPMFAKPEPLPMVVQRRSSPITISSMFKPSSISARIRSKSASKHESDSDSDSSSSSSSSSSNSENASSRGSRSRIGSQEQNPPNVLTPAATRSVPAMLKPIPAVVPVPAVAPVVGCSDMIAGNMALPRNRRTMGNQQNVGLPGVRNGGNAELAAALAAGVGKPKGDGGRNTLAVFSDGAGEITDNLMEGISEVGSSIAQGFKTSILNPLGGLMGKGRTHHRRGTSINSDLVKVSFEEEQIEIPACHGNAVIRFEFMDGDRKLGSFVYFMSQRDPKKLMFWGGENVDEINLNQGRRGMGPSGSRKMSSVNVMHGVGLGIPPLPIPSKAVMRRESLRKLSGNVDLSKSKSPFFEFRVIGGKPLVSLATYFEIRVSGIAGPLTISMHHHRGIIACLLEPYHRFFLSVNGHDGKINLFKDRKTSTPLLVILLTNVIDMSFLVDGQPSLEEGAKSSQTDVVIVMSNGEKVFFRTPDHGDRRRLQYIFLKALGKVEGLMDAMVNRPHRSSSAGSPSERRDNTNNNTSTDYFASFFGNKGSSSSRER